MVRTTNYKCRENVKNLDVFEASNIFSEWSNGVYVVYSYGRHFPMYIHVPEDCQSDKVVFTDKGNFLEVELNSFSKSKKVLLKCGTWIANSDRYSSTTAKHQSQAHPLSGVYYQLDTESMCDIAGG